MLSGLRQELTLATAHYIEACVRCVCMCIRIIWHLCTHAFSQVLRVQLFFPFSLSSCACKPNRIYRLSFMWFYRQGIYFISSRLAALSSLLFRFGLDYFHLTWHFIFMIWLLRCLWAFLRLECDIWFSFCVQLLLLFDIFQLRGRARGRMHRGFLLLNWQTEKVANTFC